MAAGGAPGGAAGAGQQAAGAALGGLLGGYNPAAMQSMMNAYAQVSWAYA
jgi:hypothetical protein